MSSEVHLTRAQKWDLARLAVAAVASSVFFSLPILLAQPRSVAVAKAPTPSVQISEEIAVAGVSEPVATANPPETAASNPRQANIVAVVTSTESARITRPVLAPSAPPAAPERTLPRSIQARARVTAPPSTTTQPATLSRRLGRFLAGNGKYDPKPFPTVTTSGM